MVVLDRHDVGWWKRKEVGRDTVSASRSRSRPRLGEEERTARRRRSRPACRRSPAAPSTSPASDRRARGTAQVSTLARRRGPAVVGSASAVHGEVEVGQADHVAVVGDHQEPVELAQEGPVVAHRDHRADEAVEGLLEGDRRVDVEVVGRLVEQEHVVAGQLEA